MPLSTPSANKAEAFCLQQRYNIAPMYYSSNETAKTQTMSDTREEKSSGVQYLQVGEENAGQRIDNFLRTQLKGVPKSMIYRILRKGEVRVNKKRVKPEYKLVVEDLVRLPPVRVALRDEPLTVSDGLLDHLNNSILFESDDLLIVNKPSGLAVHGGSGISLGLIEALRQMRPDARFLELVHRLDRDTSGCIMVAKKRSMLRHLHQALLKKQINKIYHALVQGSWSQRKSSVDAPLRKNELKSGERVVTVSEDGKAALTQFRVLRRYGSSLTLMEARPVTGRTHQIRVHCQFAGHPIIGDDKYGIDQVNQEMRQLGLKRLMLHAAELKVTLPDGEVLIVKAPLDAQAQVALDNLNKAVAVE